MITIELNLNDMEDYQRFLEIRRLPQYQFVGRTAIVPDEYARLLGVKVEKKTAAKYKPFPGLFDYQEGIARMAIAKQKFAVFAECGLGKTFIATEFARHAQRVMDGKRVLMVSPLMVVRQTIAEAKRLYGDSIKIDQVRAKDLASWMESDGDAIGITNYDAIHAGIPQGRLGALILDESSVLKSSYGKWGQECVRLGKGLDWKLALTGTPAPNDRIEFALHSVFLDAFITQNAFLAKFFVNRGETQNRWELKPHAMHPFYTALSHWSIFLTSPSTYGWKDNAGGVPDIRVHVLDVNMTREQIDIVSNESGMLPGFVGMAGGITNRSKLSQIAKGKYKGQKVETNKGSFIRDLVNSWPDDSTIIWCRYNDEQDMIRVMLPDAASIKGDTPIEVREKMIEDFQAGRIKVLISKPKILGFGLNLQIATRQVFSGLEDSYEEFWQAVKRSNRYGSIKPLDVYIPVTDLERPMVENVLRKAARVKEDTEFQERLFQSAHKGTIH